MQELILTLKMWIYILKVKQEKSISYIREYLLAIARKKQLRFYLKMQ